MPSCEQQEEVRVVFKELQGQRGLCPTPHRVVLAAHAQHRHGHFVHVSQRLVALPVGVPASRMTEQRLLQGPQGTTGEQGVCVHHFPQSRLIPARNIAVLQRTLTSVTTKVTAPV
uniref:Uncharacterized protein n=1 Tax=Scleropages formosus TaxID=113540 RepID=A0A8C9QTT1_SCLFO